MYANFVIPFVLGTLFLFGVIIYKYVSWFIALSIEQKQSVKKGFFSLKTVKGLISVFKESLLHISIYRHNRLLGYMHSSLAFGWFLLIVVGSVEVIAIIGGGSPFYVHIFFKYFHPEKVEGLALIFANIMDFLLLIVLSGVALAWYKRLKKRSMGLKKRTHHTLGDRVALSSLWLIFPVRLLAESVTSGVHGSGGFMTGAIGSFLYKVFPNLEVIELPLWWSYSIILGLFFISMPFSRYMHIITEIPHILLKYWGVRADLRLSKGDNFQVHSCSRCGICIDGCQLQSELNINNIQAVYFLRERRSCSVKEDTAHNCLMCGRCQTKCPVGIDINQLRLAARYKMGGGKVSEHRYRYFGTINRELAIEDVSRVINSDVSKDLPTVGYFAGCMTLLIPAIINSMETIFNKAGDKVWFVDRDKGVCCGRPLSLSGDVDSAQKMIDYNRNLIIQSGVKLLVTACPICLKIFKESYDLESAGIEAIHHTQYIERRIKEGKLILNNLNEDVTYHDPCELGRGLGIYDAPRNVISSVSNLIEVNGGREDAVCCGYSLANNKLLQLDKMKISSNAMKYFSNTGAKVLITACPQCKTAFNINKEGMMVKDISELVASASC